MPFTLIKGEFKPEFGRPDGDSLRFVLDDPSPIFQLKRSGHGPKINSTNGSIQLRYEAIDTMESSVSTGNFASDATDSNLELAMKDNGKGYICSRQLGPNGRPIAFVFSGDTTEADGASVFLSAADIGESVNVQQFQRGHAYPLFYDTLFDDLRDRCVADVLAAKAAGNGLWAADETTSGTTYTGDPDTMQPIYPKLWRRIDKFVKDDTFFEPSQPMANLKDWIEHEESERISVPSKGIFTGFDDILEVTDNTVKMLHEPHEVVVVSR